MNKKQHTQLEKIHIRQRDQSDCGVACLATLFKYYEGEASLEKLRELSGTSKQGTTLMGLFQAANQLGINAEGFEADIDHLKKLNDPVILHVIIDNKLQHYIIVYGYENEQFIINDPAKGVSILHEKELASIWQSKALLLIKPTNKLDKGSRAKK